MTTKDLDFLTGDNFSDASGEENDNFHDSLENSYKDEYSKSQFNNVLSIDLLKIAFNDGDIIKAATDADSDLSQVNLSVKSLTQFKVFDCIFLNKQLNLVFKIDHESKIVKVVNTSDYNDNQSHLNLLELSTTNDMNEDLTVSDYHSPIIKSNDLINQSKEHYKGYLYSSL